MTSVARTMQWSEGITPSTTSDCARETPVTPSRIAVPISNAV